MTNKLIHYLYPTMRRVTTCGVELDVSRFRACQIVFHMSDLDPGVSLMLQPVVRYNALYDESLPYSAALTAECTYNYLIGFGGSSSSVDKHHNIILPPSLHINVIHADNKNVGYSMDLLLQE